MTPEEFKTLARAVTSTRSVLSVHPVKLARWHQSLFELPELLFLQQGCGPMFDQLTSSVGAIAKMSAVLGAELAVPLRELALRHVGSWTFLVRGSSGDARSFLIRWDAKNTRWNLHSSDDLARHRRITSLEEGVDGAAKWAAELDAKSLEDEAELRETLREKESARGVEGP